jgi:hypothetical protein
MEVDLKLSRIEQNLHFKIIRYTLAQNLNENLEKKKDDLPKDN